MELALAAVENGPLDRTVLRAKLSRDLKAAGSNTVVAISIATDLCMWTRLRLSDRPQSDTLDMLEILVLNLRVYVRSARQCEMVFSRLGGARDGLGPELDEFQLELVETFHETRNFLLQVLGNLICTLVRVGQVVNLQSSRAARIPTRKQLIQMFRVRTVSRSDCSVRARVI